VAFKPVAIVARDLVLAFFDLVVRKFSDLATMGANKVIVVIAIIELKDRFTAIKLAPG
jgi:hypothetical protein